MSFRSNDNLANSQGWATNGIRVVGESRLDEDGYKTVTNRTDIGNAEFVTLDVEKTN